MNYFYNPYKIFLHQCGVFSSLIGGASAGGVGTNPQDEEIFTRL